MLRWKGVEEGKDGMRGGWMRRSGRGEEDGSQRTYAQTCRLPCTTQSGHGHGTHHERTERQRSTRQYCIVPCRPCPALTTCGDERVTRCPGPSRRTGGPGPGALSSCLDLMPDGDDGRPNGQSLGASEQAAPARGRREERQRGCHSGERCAAHSSEQPAARSGAAEPSAQRSGALRDYGRGSHIGRQGDGMNDAVTCSRGRWVGKWAGNDDRFWTEGVQCRRDRHPSRALSPSPGHSDDCMHSHPMTLGGVRREARLGTDGSGGDARPVRFECGSRILIGPRGIGSARAHPPHLRAPSLREVHQPPVHVQSLAIDFAANRICAGSISRWYPPGKPLLRVGEAKNPGPPSGANRLTWGALSAQDPGARGFHHALAPGFSDDSREAVDDGDEVYRAQEEGLYTLKVVTVNCTSWGSLLPFLQATDADVLLVQEHKLMGRDSVDDAVAWLRRHKWNALLTEAEAGPNGGASAGAAVLARDHLGLSLPPVGSEEVIRARVAAAKVEAPGTRPFVAIAAYLHDGEGLSRRNLEILKGIGNFVSIQGESTPFIIGGGISKPPPRRSPTRALRRR